MSVSITVSSVSGNSPYQIYVCDSFGAHCEYVANTSILPITIYLSSTFDYAPIVMVKIIDGDGCETFENILCSVVVTPTPTNTPTPLPTPTPIPVTPPVKVVTGCTEFSLEPPVDTVFTFINCNGECESILVFANGQINRCIRQPYFNDYAIDTEIECPQTTTTTIPPTTTTTTISPTTTTTTSTLGCTYWDGETTISSSILYYVNCDGINETVSLSFPDIATVCVLEGTTPYFLPTTGTVLTDTGTACNVTTTTTTLYIGSYFAIKTNDVFNYLGNPILEDEHINYVLCQGFNTYQMYGLYTVFASTGLSDDLAPFIDKLYAAGLNPVAIMGANTAGFDLVYNWEQTYNRQFWGVSKENEFWRYPAPDTETFSDWINSLNYIRTTYPHWHRSAYLANGSNTWGPAEASQIIAAQVDVIEVTNYNSGAPDPTNPLFLDDNLQLLANAAAAASTTQDFVPLWSSEGPPDNNYGGPYFALTPPNLGPPFAAFQIQYNALSFPNKSSMNKIGFSLFAYNDLIIWLPQCLP